MIAGVIAFAALTGPLPKLGCGRRRAAGRGRARWRRSRARARWPCSARCPRPGAAAGRDLELPQLRVVHRHPLYAVVGCGASAVVVLVALARLVAAAPGAGRAAGGARAAVPDPDPGRRHHLESARAALPRGRGRVRWPGSSRRCATTARRAADRRRLGRLGAAGRAAARAVVVLYAVQAVYSPDFEKALQQMVFFYVPFALLYRLLRDLRWTPELIRNCLRLLVVLALVFAVIGFVEYATKTIILNPKLVVDQRPAHLLHGQLGVLRSRHLRALPGPLDDPASRCCSSTTASSASSWSSSACSPSCGRDWC